MRLPLRRKRGIMYFIFFLFLVEGVWFGDVRAGTCERGRVSGDVRAESRTGMNTQRLSRASKFNLAPECCFS